MSLTRAQWKERLKDAQLDADVVDIFVDGLSDDQLVRMKEVSAQQIKDAVMAAVEKCFAAPDKRQKEDGEMDEEDEEDMAEEAATKKKESDASVGNLLEFADYIIARTTEKVTQNLKDALESQEIEVDVPILTEVQSEVASLKEAFGSMGQQLKELIKSDTERIKDNVAGMSSASRARLLRHFSTDAFAAVEPVIRRKEEEQEQRQKDAGEASSDGVIIRDADGGTYKTLGEFATAQPS